MFNIKIKASTPTELQNALMSLTDVFRVQATPQMENNDLSAEAKSRRGRPPKAKEVAPEAPETPKAPTRDDVIAALTAFSDASDPLTGSPRGQIKARQMMQTVTGMTRLIDVKPEDYPRLIAALTSDNAA